MVWQVLGAAWYCSHLRSLHRHRILHTRCCSSDGCRCHCRTSSFHHSFLRTSFQRGSWPFDADSAKEQARLPDLGRSHRNLTKIIVTLGGFAVQKLKGFGKKLQWPSRPDTIKVLKKPDLKASVLVVSINTLVSCRCTTSFKKTHSVFFIGTIFIRNKAEIFQIY